MKKKKIFKIYLITAILDQIIKCIIAFNMKVGDTITVIPKFFKINYLQNTGAAFSSFQGMRYILIIISLIIFFVIINYIKKNDIKNKIEGISLGLIMGGLIGNLIDRIIYGFVIDYLSFTIFGYSFAVFNLADSFIVIGVFLLLFDIFKEDILKKYNK